LGVGHSNPYHNNVRASGAIAGAADRSLTSMKVSIFYKVEQQYQHRQHIEKQDPVLADLLAVCVALNEIEVPFLYI